MMIESQIIPWCIQKITVIITVKIITEIDFNGNAVIF